MFCHNSSNCVVLPATSEDECEDTPICLLPGGEILWDVSEVTTFLFRSINISLSQKSSLAGISHTHLFPLPHFLWPLLLFDQSECDDIQYCTEECFGEECADQEACEEVSGFCEDPDSILPSVEVSLILHVNLKKVN